LIQNEDEIVEALVKRGFVIVDMELDALEHILATLADAKLCISIEGSHASHHTVVAPESSGLLDLQPPDRFTANHRGSCECLGMRYGFVVGSKGNAGYSFSVSEILRTADLMLRNIEARTDSFSVPAWSERTSPVRAGVL
jgi:hypothetical protein